MTHIEKMEHNRIPALDLFRFLAALVVFLGHLVFFSAYGDLFKDSYWVQSIRTGTFAVDFFFALSGFVLSAKKPTLKWMGSRVIRLYPVYFVGLCLGAFVNYVSTGSLNTDTLGVFLSFFGIQALSSQYQLVLNAPLWSLSVELSAIPLFAILFLIRNRKVYLYMSFVFSIAIAVNFGNSVVLRSLPFFVLGSIVSNFQRPRPGKFFNRILLLFVSVYFAGGSNLFSHISYSFLDLLLKTSSLCLLIYCLLGVGLGPHSTKISNELGKRSYALYAVHGPLIGISLGLWKPSGLLPFIYYVATAVVLTAAVSEIVYRCVDLMAIRKAKFFLNPRL